MDIYMYADETGNLDYNVAGGGSKYFGIGTATWTGGHGSHLWDGAEMRFRHAAIQRDLERGDGKYMWAIQPTLASKFLPWGTAI